VVVDWVVVAVVADSAAAVDSVAVVVVGSDVASGPTASSIRKAALVAAFLFLSSILFAT
jgi:hypothetical protein